MTPEQFAYWLQGFVELHGDGPTPTQWLQIKDHLALVFNKVTPQRPATIPVSPSIPEIHHIPYKPQQIPSWFDYNGTFPTPPKIIC